MKLKKGGVRGNNKLSKALNKPINSKLTTALSKKVVYLVYAVAILFAWWFLVSDLGFQTGTTITVSLVAIYIGYNFISNLDNCFGDPLLKNKKRKWKSYEDYDDDNSKL